MPKNKGLKKYNKEGLNYLRSRTIKIVKVRGEDIPFWVEKSLKKGKNVLGFTGEDLFKEWILKNKKSNLKIIKRISWKDKKAKFGKPTICFLGPKDKNLEELPKKLNICINLKYKLIAEKYLNFLERKGFVFKKFYINGSTETSFLEKLSDLVIDIVYTGKSAEKVGLEVYDKLFKSDFVIIGGKNEF